MKSYVFRGKRDVHTGCYESDSIFISDKITVDDKTNIEVVFDEFIDSQPEYNSWIFEINSVNN